MKVSKWFVAIAAVFITSLLTANIIAVKLMSIYGFILPAGVVICGGTAELPGIRDVAREVLGLPVRIGEPQELQGVVDTLQSPAFATSIGLLDWGIRHDMSGSAQQPVNNSLKMPSWLKVFLPG